MRKREKQQIEREIRETERVLYVIGWIAITIFVIGAIVLKVLDYDLRQAGIPCMFFSRTGYYCPGCGGTRATYAFLSGHLLTSIYYHPLVAYLGIGGGLYMTSHTLDYLTRGKIKGIRFRNIYAYMMVVIILIQFVYKNALIYFFHYYMLN